MQAIVGLLQGGFSLAQSSLCDPDGRVESKSTLYNHTHDPAALGQVGSRANRVMKAPDRSQTSTVIEPPSEYKILVVNKEYEETP